MTNPPPNRWRPATPPPAQPTPPRPAQPAPAQPAPALHTYLRDPRILVGGIGVLVLILALVIGGLVLAFHRDNGPGDFVLSDTQVNDVFTNGGVFTSCDLGEEFYAAAGVRFTAMEANACAGMLEDAESEDEGTVVVAAGDLNSLLTKSQRNSSTAIDDPQLRGWQKVKISETDDDDICALFNEDPDGKRQVTLLTPGSCSDLLPLAKQFQNLFNRKEFLDSDGKRSEPSLIPLE